MCIDRVEIAVDTAEIHDPVIDAGRAVDILSRVEGPDNINRLSWPVSIQRSGSSWVAAKGSRAERR